MPWMSDEKYLLMQDTRDKKITARSSHNKRTHCGRGGNVRFPSDYLSAKEKNKLNGECKTYKLNEPMTWKEFKAMPEKYQTEYIRSLRDKFGVPDTYLGEMFGVKGTSVSRVCRELNLGSGKGHVGGRIKWDRDGFYAWAGMFEPERESNDISEDASESIKYSELGEAVAEGFKKLADEANKAIAELGIVSPSDVIKKGMSEFDAAKQSHEEEMKDLALGYAEYRPFDELVTDNTPSVLIPKSGTMVFEGDIDDIMVAIANTLKNGEFKVSVSWESV